VRKRMALLLVVVIVITGFGMGFLRPAKAATAPVEQPKPVKVNTALVCLWVPALKVGLC